MTRIPLFPVVSLSEREVFSKTLRDYLVDLPNHIDAFGGIYEEHFLNMLTGLVGLNCLKFKAVTHFLTEHKVTCPAPPSKTVVCKKKFGPNEQGFICLDCFPNKQAILCESCFDPEVHFKHQTSCMNHVNMTSLYCHCGDSEVNMSNLGCPKHTAKPPKVSDGPAVLPMKMGARLAPLVKCLFDFIIDVFRCSLRLHQEYSDPSFLKNQDAVFSAIWGPRTRELVAGSFLMRLWGDHYIDLQEMSVFFKHNFFPNELDAILQANRLDDTGKLDFAANLKTLHVDSTRRDLAKFNIGVSYLSKHRGLLEDIAACCLKFLSIISSEELETSFDGNFAPYVRQILATELLRSNLLFPKSYDIRSFNKNRPVGALYQVSDAKESPLSKHTFVATRTLLDHTDVTLMSPELLRNFEDTPLEASTFGYINSRPDLKESTRVATLPRTRLDWLLKLSPSFWKGMRAQLQTIILSVLKVPKVKPTAILHIAINYPSLAQHFDHRIVESDTEQTRFWVDMLADKQMSVFIFRDLQLLRFLISSLEKALLANQTPPEVYACSFLPPKKKFVFKADILKNSQFNFLILSLRRVLKCPSLTKLITYDHVFHAQFLHFLSAFQGMNLVSLQKIKNEDRGLSLHNGSATMSYHLRDLMTFMFNSLSNNPLTVIQAARHTLVKIWAVMENKKKSASKSSPIPSFNQDAPPDDSTVSYYYILHHYLAKLLECPQLHDPSYIRRLGYSNLLHLLLGHQNHDIENHSIKKLLAIFDHPIKTLALLSRAQFHANPKKKISYIQQGLDIELDKEVVNYCYLVQIMLSIFKPEQALDKIISTYGLQNWSSPSLKHSVYSEQEHFYMAGDFIKLLVHCFTNRDDINGSAFDIKAIKLFSLYIYQPKEQAFLMQYLPPWLSQSPHFTQTLANITGFNFSPEQRKTKYPPFKLSVESAHWLNPYHYFIKQKDFLTARQVRKTHDDPAYYEVHFTNFPPGTFQNIWAIFHCPTLTKFIFYTLYHIKQSPKNHPILADYVLQLFSDAKTEYGYDLNSRARTPILNIWTNALTLEFETIEGSLTTCYELFKSLKDHPSFRQIPEKYEAVDVAIRVIGDHFFTNFPAHFADSQVAFV